MLLAQITDTHVLDPSSNDRQYVDNNARLAEAVASINAEPLTVAAVLATGDLVNDGRPGEYEQLAELLSPLQPTLLPLPGNHDDRPSLRSLFPRVPWSDTEHASWATQVEDIDIIGLDSTLPGQPGAAFDPPREAWLLDQLAATNTESVLLALHHPPFASGIDWMDKAGFVGLERLVDIIGQSHITRIVCGHLHRPITTAVAGVVTQVGLSTVQHIGLDLQPAAPPSLINDPAGYLLHYIDAGQWVTHTRYVATGAHAYSPG